MPGQLEAFLQELNAAFERGDVDFILDHMADDIHWEMVGASLTVGKEALREEMLPTGEDRLPTLHVESIITNGNRAAVEGTMTLPDGNGGIKTYGFCDLYEMSGPGSTQVRALKAFVIEV